MSEPPAPREPREDEDPYARWAHRRDPDLDGPAGPPQPPPPPAPPAGISRYAWFVGVVGLLVLAYITLNTVRTGGTPAGLARGTTLPPFAVPLLASDLTGDANLARARGTGAGKSGRTTACAIRDPRALNFCRATAGKPVVLVFAADGDRASRRQLQALDEARRRRPDVAWIGVMLRGDRARERRRARAAGWDFPLGWDRHADVAAAYGVKALPAVFVADRRRRAVSSSFRYQSPAALLRRAGAAAQ